LNPRSRQEDLAPQDARDLGRFGYTQELLLGMGRILELCHLLLHHFHPHRGGHAV
jgi:hypothetical protein